MTDFKPNQITFDITDRCQMKCVTCSKWKTVAGDVISKELTTQEWKKVLDGLHEWLGTDFWFCFSGGEPFLRPDIFEISEYAASLGINVASMTNGFSIEQYLEKIVNSSIKSLNISLNSIQNPEIHNTSRGRNESHQKIMNAIKRLNELKNETGKELWINISTIVFPENLDELVPLAEFVKENNLGGIMFQLMDDKESFHGYNVQKACPTGSYKMPDELKKEYMNMSSHACEVFDKLAEMKKDGYSIFNTFEQIEAIKMFLKNPDDILKAIDCRVGETNFAIDPYGDVRLCFNMAPVGNIRENTPKEIWENNLSKACRKSTSKCKMYCRLLNCNFKGDFLNKKEEDKCPFMCFFKKLFKH